MALNREYITFGEAARHARRIFGTMVKPAGSACNLDCAYCYYLDKAAIYGGREPRISTCWSATYNNISRGRMPIRSPSSGMGASL